MASHGDETPNALTSLAAELASDLGETANNSFGLELINLIKRFEETGDANWVDDRPPLSGPCCLLVHNCLWRHGWL